MGQTHPAKFGRRRAAMWAAGVVLGLSVAAWVVSLFQVGRAGPGFVAGLSSGTFVVRARQSGEPAQPRTGWFVAGLDWEQLWWPWGLWTPRRVVLPLWPIVLISAPTFSHMYLFSRRERRRLAIGHCPTCNYDLTGIDGVCPECGRPRP